jgi:hypothetical protein
LKFHDEEYLNGYPEHNIQFFRAQFLSLQTHRGTRDCFTSQTRFSPTNGLQRRNGYCVSFGL